MSISVDNQTNSFDRLIVSPQHNSKETQKVITKDYKPDFYDKIGEKVVNKRDVNDKVTIPRSLFKGYLSFTIGTTLNTIASFLKNNKFTTGLKIGGMLMTIVGTYEFVKPFLIKNNK